VRIDYFLQQETGAFYFIEINTVPGQTETSLISQQVRSMGMEVQAFYTQLIEEMFVSKS
jgi:D-alanine-D-alanine ligase